MLLLWTIRGPEDREDEDEDGSNGIPIEKVLHLQKKRDKRDLKA
jgi:hypothetical protein